MIILGDMETCFGFERLYYQDSLPRFFDVRSDVDTFLRLDVDDFDLGFFQLTDFLD